MYDRCGKQPLRQRKDFINDEAWQKMQEKKEVKKLLKEMDGGTEGEEEQWHRSLLRRLIRSLNKTLRKTLKADKKRYYEGLANEAKASDAPQTRHEIFQKIKSTRGATSRNKLVVYSKPSPILLNTKGKAVETFEEAQDTFLEHFGDIEGADYTTWDARRQQITEEGNQLICEHDFELDINCLPTLHQWQGYQHNGKLGRATGKDNIPEEFGKQFPTEMAFLTYPLALKMTTTCREAFQFKGGLQCCLCKFYGAYMDVDSYRQILLLESLAKK